MTRWSLISAIAACIFEMCLFTEPIRVFLGIFLVSMGRDLQLNYCQHQNPPTGSLNVRSSPESDIDSHSGTEILDSNYMLLAHRTTFQLSNCQMNTSHSVISETTDIQRSHSAVIAVNRPLPANDPKTFKVNTPCFFFPQIIGSAVYRQRS